MTTIKPLTIANRTFPVNLIQGPLAGVSCAPFRRLTWHYSKPAFSCTEMISAKTLCQPIKDNNIRYIAKSSDEGPVCFQLSANNRHDLAEATKRATDYGADLIDLNCGCPVKKIRSKGAGSSLLTYPTLLYHLISAMKQNTHVPISIKIRVEAGIDSFNRDVAQVVAEAGADYLIVHGRHWTDDYSVTCRYDEIQFFVEQLKIPVIGNGDIACVTTLKKMLATGVAGVMISRAGCGQPWLIAQLIAQLNQQPFNTPSYEQINAIFIDHARELSLLLQNEKLAILQMRKLAKYYARHFTQSREFCARMNTCESLQDLIHVCGGEYDRKLDCASI